MWTLRFLRNALSGFWQMAQTFEGMVNLLFLLVLVAAFLVLTVGGGMDELWRRWWNESP